MSEAKKTPAELWVEALRSGRFAQTTSGCLHDDVGHCCLGVACEVYAIMHQGWRYDGSESSLPSEVCGWLGMRDALGRYDGDNMLAWHNDDGVPFSEIADIIESHPLGLFWQASDAKFRQPIESGRMTKGGHNVLAPNAKRPPAPQGSGGPGKQFRESVNMVDAYVRRIESENASHLATIAAQSAEIARLTGLYQQWLDTHAACMDETCDGVEKHCTCVGTLRESVRRKDQEISRLREACKALPFVHIDERVSKEFLILPEATYTIPGSMLTKIINACAGIKAALAPAEAN